MMSNIWFQNAPVQKPGTTPRSWQISTKVRPSERRRTWRSRSSSVGMKSSGSSEPVRRDGRGAALRLRDGSAGGSDWGGRWCGRCFGRAGARGRDVDVWAGCSAREEHTLQRSGTQDATVQVGEDGGEVGGAEACRDGGECGGSGALADGGAEMAAVAEQDAEDVEEEGDVLGHGAAGAILRRIGRRGGAGLSRRARKCGYIGHERNKATR